MFLNGHSSFANVNALVVHVCSQGEPFPQMKERLLKKLGVQEKEFEKVGVPHLIFFDIL